MSHVHILTVNGHVQTVFHLDVPNTNNSAGTNWRAAVLNSGMGGTTVLKDGDGTGTNGTISTAEKTNILNGSVVEVVLNIKARELAGKTLVQIYNTYSGDLLSGLQSRLNRFGSAGG